MFLIQDDRQAKNYDAVRQQVLHFVVPRRFLMLSGYYLASVLVELLVDTQAHVIFAWNLAEQDADLTVAVFSYVFHKCHFILLEVRRHRRLFLPGPGLEPELLLLPKMS